jgi:uncharacterized integral membrane protein
MIQKIRWFVLLLGITLVLLLSLWNSAPVTLQFPFLADRQLPLSVLIFTTFAIGFLFGALMTGWMLHRRKKQASKTGSSAASPSEETSPSTEPSETASVEGAGSPAS